MKRPQLAVIAPIALQATLDLKYDLMGDYHLLLAHQVLEHRARYFDYYMALRRSGRDPLVIMDNSLIELGRALPADDLAAACEAVGARYLILPDVMRDAFATVDKSMLAYRRLRNKVPEGTEFMAVLHGATMTNVAFCLNQLAEGMGRDLTAVCVPRVMTEQFGSRGAIIKMVGKETGLPIHLLGFSRDLTDDLMCSAMGGVMGIDSAYPIWSGRMEIIMKALTDYCAEARRPSDFWEYAHVAPAMIYNVMQFRKWFQR